MDISTLEEAQKICRKIEACNALLQVPKQNSIPVRINSLYPVYAIIPVDLWCKILEDVKKAKQQYEKELKSL